MCIIVDANFANSLVRPDERIREDIRPILRWINDGGRMVAGGQLIKEYRRCSGEFLNLFRVLGQGGQVRTMKRDIVEGEAARIREQCKSNDEHIIALARISKTRLLCTHDKLLSQDFTSFDLLRSPRGKVYKNRKHKHLLDSVRCR